jgi:Rieske Fe-S protein
MTQPLHETDGAVNRRAVVVGAATFGAGLLAAGCAGPAPSPASVPVPTVSAPAGGAASAPVPLGPAADIPVGGGRIYADRQIVVTQPAANDFKAFNAKCTHAGCTVSKVENGLILCPCHGSAFSITDGSVRNGPATKPLKPANITVDAGQIRLLE